MMKICWSKGGKANFTAAIPLCKDHPHTIMELLEKTGEFFFMLIQRNSVFICGSYEYRYAHFFKIFFLYDRGGKIRQKKME